MEQNSAGKSNLKLSSQHFPEFKADLFTSFGGKARMKHPVGIIIANLLQMKENRKLKFILPMLYYVDTV